ncbi:MAG: adenosine deaminase [Acidimicrobiales bacterium]
MTVTVPSQEWVRGLPKAEVHLHLEGCLPAELLRDAAARAGIFDNRDEQLPLVTSLTDLLAHLDWSCALIDQAHQLEEAAYSITTRASQSGAGHVDVIVNPTHWPHWKLRLGEMIDALDAGFRAGELDNGTTAVLCVSVRRDQSRSAAVELTTSLVELEHPRVGALSIDGNEAGGASSHNERFAPAFEMARRAGLRRCAHAGESSGAAGVREAIEILGAERIEHGVRCLEDPTVVDLVVDRGVALGVCPTSNVVLGVVATLASHPLGELLARGVRCSINTDDPLLYGIDLTGEYLASAKAFGWGQEELGAVARVAIESSFAREDRRDQLCSQLDAYLISTSEPSG